MGARRITVLAASILFVAGCGSSSTIFGSTSTSTSSSATAAQSSTGATSGTTARSAATVTSIDRGFETVVPSGFIDATRSVRSGVANVQYLAIGPRSQGFATNINVIRDPAQGRTDINQIAGLEIATIKRLDAQARNFSQTSSLTVGGEPARSVDYSDQPSGDRLLHQRQVFVVHEGMIYTITYSALPSAYDANVGAVDKVAAGWRWL